MHNSFYAQFDEETYGTRHIAPGEYRTPFEIDRDRVIHSTAFRRLQGKTQVYITGRGDQYRTRLTHSIEVAQIGRSMVNYLNRVHLKGGLEFAIDGALVEAACLAHDLGNPPMGHKGEARLNQLMAPWGGFEGNAQSLRILTRIIRGESHRGKRGGLAPTRAFLDGVLKYKVLRTGPQSTQTKFLYPDQREILEWVHNGQELTERSLECAIMDLSDDIAYCTSDLFDGYKQGLVTPTTVAAFFEKQGSAPGVEYLREALEQVFRREKSLERTVAGLVGFFITSCYLEEIHNPPLVSNRYRYCPKMREEARVVLEMLRKMNFQLIYHSPLVREQEQEGVAILEAVFKAYQEVYYEQRPWPSLLPLPPYLKQVLATPKLSEPEAMRRICDHIAGMTDSYVQYQFAAFNLKLTS